MQLGACFTGIGSSIVELLIFISHAVFRSRLGKECLGFSWSIGFWHHTESVCAYMGGFGGFGAQGELI